MLYALQVIAERRISEAIENGSIRCDGWKNRPLPLDDDGQVPDDLKMAYKILKNAGFLPPEVEARKEIERLEELIAQTEDEHMRVRQLKKLDFLLLKLNSLRQRPVQLEQYEEYHRKITEKIAVSNRNAQASKSL